MAEVVGRRRNFVGRLALTKIVRFMRCSLLVVLALAIFAGGASATATRVDSWTPGGRVDPGAPSALACPSSVLCVAVDKGGEAVVTRDPAAGAIDWTIASIDPGGSLSGVSCPSVGLCVAVDIEGRVLTSTNPASGASSWSAGVVEPAGLASVSCPTASLCVAVGGQDVAFSNDPAAGASSWTLVRNVDQAIDYQCGKYMLGACSPLALVSVSCPSASVCQAVDIDGGGVRSSDPGTVGGWPSFGGLELGNNGGLVACRATGVCLEQCAVGFGGFFECPGSDYGAGDVVAVTLAGTGHTWYQTISTSPLSGLWCAASGCFAADRNGELFASGNPGDRHAWWQRLRAAASRSAAQPSFVTALACPSVVLCLALTSNGELLHGPPPATRTAVRASLHIALGLAASHMRLRLLIQKGGYRERIMSLVPGRLTITWSQRHSHTVVARVNHYIRRAGVTTITIALTQRGKRLVETVRGLKLTASGTLAPDGTPPITSAGNLSLPVR